MKHHKFSIGLIAAFATVACATAPIDLPALPTAGPAPSLEAIAASGGLDVQTPLSSDQLSALAVLSNPDLQAMRAQRGVAEAQLYLAGLVADPTLSLGFDVPVSGPDTATALAAALGLDLLSFLRRKPAETIARADLDALQLDIAWAEWQTAQQARLLCAQVFYLQRIKDMTTRFRELTNIELGRAVRAASRGDLASSALETRRIAATDAADRDRTAQLNLAKARLDLNRVLGIDPAAAFEVRFAEQDFEISQSAEALFLDAAASRADLAALREAYQSGDSQLFLNRLAAYPIPSLSLNGARDTAKVVTLGPSVSVTLPVWNGGRGDVAVTKAKLAKARAEYAARLETIRADIASASTSLSVARAQKQDVMTELAPLKPQADSAERAAKRGDVSLSTADAARIAVLDKQITAVALAQSQAEFLIALEIAVGRRLGDPV